MNDARAVLLLLAALAIVGCASEPPQVSATAAAPAAPGAAPAPPGPPGSAQPQAPVSPPAAPKEFHLGTASSALVAQAHKQAAAGNPDLALTTLERALRIEPDNPLLWIEMGQLQQMQGHYEQADSMGRKALQLAGADTHAQSSAWELIAASLRARGRNAEASAADAHAHTVVVR
jgi:tetratricopeptide (TPR) repeat protein